MSDKKNYDIVQGIRKRMRDAIKGSGRTIKSFSEEYFLDESNFYNNHAYPNSYVVITVAEACNVTTDYILRGVEK